MSAETNHSAWERELSRLENEIAQAKDALSAGQVPDTPQGWQPPRLGKIPTDLRARAQSVRAELSEVQQQVQIAMENNRAERDRLHVAPTRQPDAKPLYLDVQG